MLKNQPVINALLINLLLGAVWHYATFFLCISINTGFFNPKRKIYQSHKWEKDGKFYSNVLKINKWKDFLPQHIGKDGFSKDHIDDVSIEYIDEFIMETCRGEWNHSMNCLFSIALLLMNNLWMGIILSILLLIGNVPFAVIQRYNRFRLQKLKKMILRKHEHTNRHSVKNTAEKSSDTEHTADAVGDDTTVNQI